MTFAQYLSGQNVIDDKTLSEAINESENQEKTLISFLAQENLISAATLLEHTKKFFNANTIDLTKLTIKNDVISLLPKQLLNNMNVLPIENNTDYLSVAIIDPSDYVLLQQIEFYCEKPIEIFLARFDHLQKIIKNFITGEQASSLAEENDIIEIKSEEAKKKLSDDKPIVQFINSVIEQAVQRNASDIHFEVYEKFCRVRLRQDGLLHEFANPERSAVARLVARLKIMANLDISERRIPQDGSIKFSLTNQSTVDIRVNSCPTMYGEKIVLRILETNNILRKIGELGFNDQQLNLFLKAVEKPQGLILVTGPTGSGKTITLYAALQHLNVIEKNISTVEDPVEIKLSGINQVNVNQKAQLFFSTALRAFLRQDPDIIMVGEIRDPETAEIAIKAAQTGHLVLSTLHTNDALQAISRLANMGIENYNLSSSISLIIAQRLARKLCDHCKAPDEISSQVLIDKFGYAKNTTAYKPRSCDRCTDGYSGRIAIHEVLSIDTDMQKFIISNSENLTLRKKIQEAFYSLSQSALEKVSLGLTSLAEIYRVIEI